MQIKYRTKKIEKVCINASVATKSYGSEMAFKIHLRIDQISAANDVLELVNNSIGRCHALKGNKNGQYAMDLVHPYRLIFIVEDNQISVAEIQEIVDYH